MKKEDVEKVTMTDAKEIIYIENRDRKTFVVSASGEYTVNKPFKDIKLLVMEEGEFIESHKSFVVNKRFLESFDKTTAVLKCGEKSYTVHISRRKYYEFRKKME